MPKLRNSSNMRVPCSTHTPAGPSYPVRTPGQPSCSTTTGDNFRSNGIEHDVWKEFGSLLNKKTRMFLLLDAKASGTKICHTRREGYMYRVYVFLNPFVSNLPTYRGQYKYMPNRKRKEKKIASEFWLSRHLLTVSTNVTAISLGGVHPYCSSVFPQVMLSTTQTKVQQQLLYSRWYYY